MAAKKVAPKKNSAASKRIAEEKIASKSRRDKYGQTGMGETRTGVMRKDLKELAKTNKKLPKDAQGAVQSFTKRGNINEIYFGPGFAKPKKKK